MREHEWSTRLMLNGEAIRLSTALDVVDQVHGRRTFEIGILDGERTYNWTCAGERSELSMAVESVLVDGARVEDPEVLRYLMPPEADGNALLLARRLRDATHITAERTGPREIYPLRACLRFLD